MIKPFRGNYILTQGFGGNKDWYTQFGMQGHNGLDYGLPTGTQLIAPHAGKVLEAASDPSGYGLYVKIESDVEGSVIAHMQSFQVKVGDIVSEGQPIGFSDNTGNSTGPHLHWGYYKIPRNRQNGYSGMINQLPLISVEKPSTPTTELLAIPNPGYAPTFEGQTVEKDGIKYKSYKDSNGKLLWKIEAQDDWKKKYEEEVKKTTSLTAQVSEKNTRIQALEKENSILSGKISAAKVALA